ncbi:MAG: LysR family transcriptional regulator, partial [Rhodospirillaceae bacterium]|nr:LysR family transcriptional regulator [Rhodospirillaceae bacterium]
MDIKQLRNFISIVDHKSFSKAAAFRNLSQPAISLSISNLEKEVDAQLLIRKRNEVTLTELGQAFILHARAALR